MKLDLSVKYAARHVLRDLPMVAARSRRMRRYETRSAEELRAWQERMLRRTLECAAQAIPAYRDLRGLIPSTDVVDFLHALPVVSRSTLLAERQRYYPHGGRAMLWWLIGETSGTTGTPLDIFRSYDSTLWEQAFCRQHWAWAGWSPGERQVVLRGDLIVPVGQTAPPYWFHDGFGQQLIVSSRHVKPQHVAAIAKAIRSYAPVQLRAYPSAAYSLAMLFKDQGMHMHVRSIITGSESLLPLQRQVIESAFGGRIFDHYGMAERVAFGMECEYGSMHIHPEYSFVEILDAAGSPTDGPGYVVGTTFHNRVMPLIRYRLNDMAQWGTRPCPCGRPYPYVETLGGKVEDQLFDRERQPVSASVITFAFKGVPYIAKAQVAQVDAERWIIRVVPLPGFGAGEQGLLLGKFRSLVSDRVEATIQLLDEIPAQPSGKYKWVSQEYYAYAAGRWVPAAE